MLLKMLKASADCAEAFDRLLFSLNIVGIRRRNAVGIPEKQRDTPYARKGNERIHDPAEDRPLPAEDSCDDVKLKQTDAAPVERADYHKSQ